MLDFLLFIDLFNAIGYLTLTLFYFFKSGLLYQKLRIRLAISEEIDDTIPLMQQFLNLKVIAIFNKLQTVQTRRCILSHGCHGQKQEQNSAQKCEAKVFHIHSINIM